MSSRGNNRAWRKSSTRAILKAAKDGQWWVKMLNIVKVASNPAQRLAAALSLTEREGLTIALLSGLTILCLLIVGCQGKPPATPAAPPAPAISYKTRAEHASAKIEKEYRLSETETIKVVIVPGFPMGERCVIYSNGRGNAMPCREIMPGQQLIWH